MKEAFLLHPHDSDDFRQHLFKLLDQTDSSHPDPLLQRRLTAVREAQADIRAGRFTPADEKVIHYIATNFKSFRKDPVDVALFKAKQQYHAMKNDYLSRYSSQKITAANLIRGLRGIFSREVED